MQLEEYFDFLGPDEIRIKGHRIGLEHVIRWYREGWSPEQIATQFPGLPLEKIHASITYYLHDRDAVDAYMQRGDEQSEREYQEWLAAPPSPVVARLRALKAEKARQRHRSA